jgi:hypothetical protein
VQRTAREKRTTGRAAGPPTLTYPAHTLTAVTSDTDGLIWASIKYTDQKVVTVGLVVRDSWVVDAAPYARRMGFCGKPASEACAELRAGGWKLRWIPAAHRG